MSPEVYVAIQAIGLVAILLGIMATMVAGIIWIINHVVGRGEEK